MAPAARWRKPDSGCIKLNVDGSYRKGGVEGGTIAGVARDCEGQVKFAFYKFFEAKTSFEAELMSLDEGVRLLKMCKFNKVQIESDCSSLVEQIQKVMKVYHITSDDKSFVEKILSASRTLYNTRDMGRLTDVIREQTKPEDKFYTLRIKKCLKKMEYEIHHVERDLNSVADKLTDMGYLNRSFKIYTGDKLKRFGRLANNSLKINMCVTLNRLTRLARLVYLNKSFKIYTGDKLIKFLETAHLTDDVLTIFKLRILEEIENLRADELEIFEEIENLSADEFKEIENLTYRELDLFGEIENLIKIDAGVVDPNT